MTVFVGAVSIIDLVPSRDIMHPKLGALSSSWRRLILRSCGAKESLYALTHVQVRSIPLLSQTAVPHKPLETRQQIRMILGRDGRLDY